MQRTKTDRNLWHRLEGYSFHERPLTRSLVDRLEEETGHPTDVCYILVEEYRRFMYLIGSSTESLAPSPIVDIVWRLHTEDHRAYFEDFCPRVIGRTIHRPEAEPRLDFSLLDDPDYINTLDLYAQEFGRPQVQFWPDPDFASKRLSSVLFWLIAVAALLIALVFKSTLFAVFGLVVVAGVLFLRWKFTSLPLQNPKPHEAMK